MRRRANLSGSSTGLKTAAAEAKWLSTTMEAARSEFSQPNARALWRQAHTRRVKSKKKGHVLLSYAATRSKS